MQYYFVVLEKLTILFIILLNKFNKIKIDIILFYNMKINIIKNGRIR